MDKEKSRRKRLKRLSRDKVKSLGIFERIEMKYVGRIDGRKGLLRCDANGIWQSSTLKQEIDAYEEFCAEEYGALKLMEEEEFKKINVLFDKVVPLRKKLLDAREVLCKSMNEPEDLTLRKEGEENLTEVQVIARRSREKSERLYPLQIEADKYEKQLTDVVDEIFKTLSQVQESYDTANRIINRLLQHSHRRIDVYWRSAARCLPELPALPNVTFTNFSERGFAAHYNVIVEKAEKLRNELASELYGEAA